MNRATVFLRAAVAVVLAGATVACSGGAGDGVGAARVNIQLTTTGCVPASLTLEPGPVTFMVSNPGSSPATSFAIEDAEGRVERVTNVLGGLSRNLHIELTRGTYLMHCGERSGTIVVESTEGE